MVHNFVLIARKLHFEARNPCPNTEFKICCKAFQHFLESHVKSVRRLRKKEGGGAVKTIRRAALHETAYHCQRNAVSKVTIRRFGNIRKLDSERKKL